MPCQNFCKSRIRIAIKNFLFFISIKFLLRFNKQLVRYPLKMKTNSFGLRGHDKIKEYAYFKFCLCLEIDWRWICARACIVLKKRPLTSLNGLGGQKHIKHFQLISTAVIFSSFLFIFWYCASLPRFLRKLIKLGLKWPQMTSYDIKIKNWTCLFYFWSNFRKGL